VAQVQEFYRRDVDGLRAIAILAVVAYHTGIPGAQGGFVGVDVFFVISGYLITSLLVAEVARDGRVSLQSFYARRIRRLFPALFVVVCATVAAATVLLLPIFDQQQDLARSSIATALYVSNFYFWLNSPGYFDTSVDLKPLLHTWSLAVEEQFYLVWPAMVAGALAWSGPARERFERSLLAVVLLVLATSLAWCVYSTSGSPEAAFYLLPSRAWELATGGALAIVLPHCTRRTAGLGGLLAALGVAAIVAAVVLLREDMAFPGYLAGLPVFGTALVILGGHLSADGRVTRGLAAGPMVRLGLLSYSWYLWHWPVLALARAYTLEETDFARDIALAAASLLPAYLSYRYVECPVRFRRPGPFRRTETTLAAGVAISAVTCMVAGTLGLWARHEGSHRAQYSRLSAAAKDRPPMRQRCHQNPPFEGLTPVRLCVAGNPSVPVQLVLWGDSHADHLSPLLQAFSAERRDVAFLARSFSGCTPVVPPLGQELDDHPACRDFDAAVYREIVVLRSHGLRGVVLSARWLRRSEPQEEARVAMAEDAAGTIAIAESHRRVLDRTIRGLTELGLRVVVVAPIPNWPFNVPACLARRDAAACTVSRESVERERAGIMVMLRELQSRLVTVRILDPLEGLCDERYCYAERDGRVLFLDDRHMTATASRSLLPQARRVLQWATSGS